MTLEQIIKKKVDSLETIPDKFISVVDKQNEKLFDSLLKLMDKLEKDGDNIAVSSKNTGIIEQVTNLMSEVLFESDYVEGLKSFVGSFSEQAGLINDIFSEQFEFVEKDIYKGLIRQSQKSTLQFLDDDAIGQAVFEPLEKNLITNVYSGGKYSEMVKGMKEYVLGTDGVDPKLTSYVKRYARDSIAIFDNSYTQLVAQDAGVELWEYSGGTLKDSREFCLQRHGNVYTTEEIASWASKEWQGKNPATDETTIFAYRGGYNCIHSFIPRDPNFVEKSEINKYN